MMKFTKNVEKAVVVSASALMLLGIGAPAVSQANTNVQAESVSEAINKDFHAANQDQKNLDKHAISFNQNINGNGMSNKDVQPATPNKSVSHKKANKVNKAHKFTVNKMKKQAKNTKKAINYKKVAKKHARRSHKKSLQSQINSLKKQLDKIIRILKKNK